MTDQPAQEVRLLRAAYAAFNARDIDAALALMTADVTWPKAFKGGFVRGPDEIRAYWTEQWSEIDPHVEPVAFYPQADSQVLRSEEHTSELQSLMRKSYAVLCLKKKTNPKLTP